MTKPGHVERRGGEGRERSEMGPGTAVKRARVQKWWVIEMPELCAEELLGEGQPSPWVGELRIEGRVFQPYPVMGRD